MDPNKRNPSRLELLPQDLLGKIVAKVVADSCIDYHNCILSCKELGASAADERVSRKLNLAPLVRTPLAATNYKKIMDFCLANNNVDAHYIQGILDYFINDNTNMGLHHLCYAADAGHKEALYLSGVILLCRDRAEEGKKYLTHLEAEEDMNIMDTCWTNIKTSLRGITVARKPCYYQSLQKMKASITCYLSDINNSCAECFHYKTMYKFVFMI